MKYVVLVALSLIVQQLDAQQESGSKLSEAIARRMTDSLGLNSEQYDSLYSINSRLSDLKSDARNDLQSKVSLPIRLQKIESARDSLYRGVLTDLQFNEYLSRKRDLVRSN